MTTPLAKIILACIAVYFLIGAIAYLAQRRLTYFPLPDRVSPQEAGLSDVVERTLETPDGERVLAWYGRAKPGQPTLLYFHGNGGNLDVRSERIRRYLERGRGMFMMSYRGYSGSTGLPSEVANVADARLAYNALLAEGVKPQDIILYGESLGTGIATRLAAEVPVGGIILESPYTAIVDIGATRYPFLPVRLLMRDRYEQLSRIGQIRAPLLIVHGRRDRVVPFEMGEQVFAAAPEPKEMIALPRAGHNDHYLHGSYDLIGDWIDRLRAGKIGAPPVSQ